MKRTTHSMLKSEIKTQKIGKIINITCTCRNPWRTSEHWKHKIWNLVIIYLIREETQEWFYNLKSDIWEYNW